MRKDFDDPVHHQPEIIYDIYDDGYSGKEKNDGLESRIKRISEISKEDTRHPQSTAREVH